MNTIHGEMKMLVTNIAQKPASFQSSVKEPQQTQCPRPIVYEYSLTVVNFADQDLQDLTAAFVGEPTRNDWHNWFAGWNSCGYYLLKKPQLIRTIN